MYISTLCQYSKQQPVNCKIYGFGAFKAAQQNNNKNKRNKQRAAYSLQFSLILAKDYNKQSFSSGIDVYGIPS